jgi:hypothetical protein
MFALLLGLFVAVFAVEPLVRLLLRRVRLEELPAISGWSKEEPTLTPFVNDRGAMWLGRLERALFFFAFWMGAPELIGGWLLFKVATKWEAWQNIVKLPDQIEGLDPVDYLRYRHAWGMSIMQSFLAGTLANVLGAFGSVAIGRWILELSESGY